MLIKQNYTQYAEYAEQLDTYGDNTDEYQGEYVLDYSDEPLEPYDLDVSDFNIMSLQHFTKERTNHLLFKSHR